MKISPLTGAGEPLAKFFSFYFIILTYKINVVWKHFPSRGPGNPWPIFLHFIYHFNLQIKRLFVLNHWVLIIQELQCNKKLWTPSRSFGICEGNVMFFYFLHGYVLLAAFLLISRRVNLEQIRVLIINLSEDVWINFYCLNINNYFGKVSINCI